MNINLNTNTLKKLKMLVEEADSKLAEAVGIRQNLEERTNEHGYVPSAAELKAAEDKVAEGKHYWDVPETGPDTFTDVIPRGVGVGTVPKPIVDHAVEALKGLSESSFIPAKLLKTYKK